MKKITAVYCRVSTATQDIKSQEPDLRRWIENQEVENVKWYLDKASGKTMDRPGWNKLQQAMEAGRIARLVVWRLDRLGRTASGLTRLFEDLQKYKVKFESVKDRIDLDTTAGRLIANVLASVAAYETEVRAERVKAGQAVAKKQGKRWGGSAKGTLHKITQEQVCQILKMKKEGEKIAIICRTVGVNRPTIYRVVRRADEGHYEFVK